MPTRIANMDRVGYTVSDGKGGRLFRSARKGETMELDTGEAERLDAIDGAVVGGDDEVNVGPAAYAPNIEQVAAVAAIGHPVELHDNARTDLLAKFGPTLAGAPGSTEPPGGAMSGAGDPNLDRLTVTAGAPASDEELAGKNATELVAYLNQHNDEVDRVAAVNEARGEKAWASVTKAVDAVRGEQEAQEATGSTPTE